MGEVLDGLDLSGTEHTEAGIYIADSWAFNDMSGNYNDTAGSVDDNISKADATCLVEGYNVVYDGEPHSASGTCTGVKGEELPMLDLAATEHTDVGSYNDYWVFTDETGNYNDTAGFVDDVINQADASCTIYSYDVVFDGQSHFATGECLGMMGEVLEGLDFSATEHAVPGEYQDIWTFTETNGNYAYQSGFVYDTIHKADPTCEVNGYNVEYDGEAHSAGGSCTGVWDEPLAGLDLSNTVHTAVGSYEDSWTYTDQTGLYNDISNVVNDEITLREITVTADAQTKVYGQSDPELTYQVTVGSLLTSDEFSGGLTRVSGENVGSYAILQGTLSLPDYYHLNFVGATLTITGHVIWIPIIRR
jgi:hypothetical protein